MIYSKGYLAMEGEKIIYTKLFGHWLHSRRLHSVSRCRVQAVGMLWRISSLDP